MFQVIKNYIFFKKLCSNRFNKKEPYLKKHHSIISFKIESLINFAKLPQGKIEKIEGIELMRALENNFNVGTFLYKEQSFCC